jgi:hypothetical protein
MHGTLRGAAAFAGIATLFAMAQSAQQTPQTAGPQQPAGVEATWDIAPVLLAIGTHATQLGVALDKINARAWIDKGASETYARQLTSSREQVQAVGDEAVALARNPEQLAASLQLFFRIQAVETMLQSVEEGIRRYQTAADAEVLASLVAEDSANRDRLQRYILNLASDREHALQVMDKEAQRCRGLLATPCAPLSKSKKK